MTMADNICECCEKEKPIVGVASLPYMPMSIAWCADCLRADVIPFWAAANNTACCGGLEHTNQGWKDLVERSLKYHNKTQKEFDEAVEEFNKNIENYGNVTEDGYKLLEDPDDLGF